MLRMMFHLWGTHLYFSIDCVFCKVTFMCFSCDCSVFVNKTEFSTLQDGGGQIIRCIDANYLNDQGIKGYRDLALKRMCSQHRKQSYWMMGRHERLVAPSYSYLLGFMYIAQHMRPIYCLFDHVTSVAMHTLMQLAFQIEIKQIWKSHKLCRNQELMWENVIIAFEESHLPDEENNTCGVNNQIGIIFGITLFKAIVYGW